MTTEAPKPARRLVTLSELEPKIHEAFASGKSFWLPVTGTSNLPTLAGGRDSVILDRVQQPLKKGELPLYQRDSGQYVLHRIVSVQQDGTYTCCGDHQTALESGIRPDQIIGRVIWINRKGKEFSVRQLRYRIWVRLWVFLRPCRGFLLRVYHAVGRIRQTLAPKH